jgi:hypothetical protein
MAESIAIAIETFKESIDNRLLPPISCETKQTLSVLYEKCVTNSSGHVELFHLFDMFLTQLQNDLFSNKCEIITLNHKMNHLKKCMDDAIKECKDEMDELSNNDQIGKSFEKLSKSLGKILEEIKLLFETNMVSPILFFSIQKLCFFLLA